MTARPTYGAGTALWFAGQRPVAGTVVWVSADRRVVMEGCRESQRFEELV